MSGDPKDPAIKLFGKTIPLPEAPLEGTADPDCDGIQETSSLPDEDISRDQDDAGTEQVRANDLNLDFFRLTRIPGVVDSTWVGSVCYFGIES